MPVPNGNAPEAVAETSQNTSPAVVGINFGNTYASIAVLTKDGQAECIANEDGERQIACAIAFHGEETCIGNQATAHLVKNNTNTITNFRNLLGKKFSEISQNERQISAPVIQHPDEPDVPAYKVQVLQPAPTPIRTATPSLLKSSANTPAASQIPTPRSEPIPAERILTVAEVNTMFIRSLVQSAKDFLGRPIEGAVISVPSWFDDKARAALEAAAEDAGVKVMQLVEDGAAAAVMSTTYPLEGLHLDRTALVVDLGQSSLSLEVLSIRHGLVYSLASLRDTRVGGDKIDEKLLKFFAKDFTKKAKVGLTVCPPADSADKRAEAKLRLALEHTKRTISASPGAATCSVESLKDGYDYTGTINRLRFDMEVRSVYNAVCDASKKVLEQAGLESLHVDEIIYIGGSASLPGLDQAFFDQGFPETIITPFTAGTVIGGGPGDPTTIVARGCALQAQVLTSIDVTETDLRSAFTHAKQHAVVKATTKTIGVIFPGETPESNAALGGQWVVGVPQETPLPYRRHIQYSADLGGGNSPIDVGMEIWEVEESVKVTKVKPPQEEDEEDEDYEPEEIEVREKAIEKGKQLAMLRFTPKSPQKEAARWKSRLQTAFVVHADGSLSISVWEVVNGQKGEVVASCDIPAA